MSGYVNKQKKRVQNEHHRNVDGSETFTTVTDTSNVSIRFKRKPETADEGVVKLARVSWAHDFMYKFTSRFSEGKGVTPPSLGQIQQYKAPKKTVEYDNITKEYSDSSLLHKSLEVVLPVLWPSLLEEETDDTLDRKDELRRVVERHDIVTTSFASMSSVSIIRILQHRSGKLNFTILNTDVPRVMKFIGRNVCDETEIQVAQNGSICDTMISRVICDNPTKHKDYKALQANKPNNPCKSVVPSMTAMVFRAVTSLTDALRIINKESWGLASRPQLRQTMRKKLLIYLEQVRIMERGWGVSGRVRGQEDV
jgi:hypothetical protein